MRRPSFARTPAARPLPFGALLALISGCVVKDDERCARDPASGADEAVQLLTRDDVCLSADLYAGGDEVGVLLVHPDGDAAGDWDPSFLACLGELGTVLAIDRRGAGASEANPEGAPDTDADRNDVDAGAAALTARGLATVFVVGVGESTAGVLDYGVWAGSGGASAPDALALIGAGPATEAKSSFAAMAATFVPTQVLVNPAADGLTDDWRAQLEQTAGADWALGEASQTRAGDPLPAGEVAGFFAAVGSAGAPLEPPSCAAAR